MGKAKRSAQTAGVKMPPFEQDTTPEGLQIHAAQRGPLPLVALRLIIRAGSAFDPKGKEGLSDFTVRLLRRGAGSLDAEALNEAVEFAGTSLGLGSAEDFVSIGITTPAEHLAEMLRIMGLLVREPRFDEKELATARERTIAQQTNDLDDPGHVADRMLTRAVWGAHPYGHEINGTPSSVRTFTREDCVRFHRERIGPKVATLIVVGAARPAEVFRAAREAFAGWTGGPASVEAPPPIEKLAREGAVILVDKPEQTQTQLRLASMGFKKGHPDLFAARVMNISLGEGFTSRLVDEIRVKRGLTYGVGSHFDALAAGGTFGVSTFTKTESTAQIIQVARTVIEKVRKGGLSPKEVTNAKTYLAGLYPLRLETNEALAGAKAEMVLFGLGDDWVERYRERVHVVTPKQVKEVAARYLFPADPVLVAVGNAEKAKLQLKRFGDVEVVRLPEVA
jgi:zinc protease